MNLEEYQKAVLDFNRAISINPEYVLAYYNRGKSYDYLEKYEIGDPDFKKISLLDLLDKSFLIYLPIKKSEEKSIFFNQKSNNYFSLANFYHLHQIYIFDL